MRLDSCVLNTRPASPRVARWARAIEDVGVGAALEILRAMGTGDDPDEPEDMVERTEMMPITGPLFED